jgi:hypothetical protein
MNYSSFLSLKKQKSIQLLLAGFVVLSLIAYGCSGTAASSKVVGVAAGNSSPDILTNDKNGKTLQLSALKGSYVLVEFWESGNMDARRNHYEINRLYQKYQDAQFKDGKNFCIYSVSLDTNKDKWLEAMAQDNVSWPCQTIDTKGWNAKSAIDFGVSFLPKYYLINGDGVIIKRNILIQDLESIIKAELS